MAGNTNIITPGGLAVNSPVIDYDLRNLASYVSGLKLNQFLVYNASLGTAPALGGTGDIVFTTPSGTVSIAYADIQSARVLQAVAAAAGVWQLDLDTTPNLPTGNDLSVWIQRWNQTDAFPVEYPIYRAFDPAGTYTAAQRITAVVSEINTQQSLVTASANGTTGIFLTANNAGDLIEVFAGVGFNAATNTTPVATKFGYGSDIKLIAGIPPTQVAQIVDATAYRIIEINYHKWIRTANSGFAFGQTDGNNGRTRIAAKAWIAFDSASTQDTNFNAATTILLSASDLRQRKLLSASPVN